MRQEFLEEAVSAVEAALLVAGAKDFEEGIGKAKRLVGFIYAAIQPIETRDDFKKALAACPEPALGEPEKILLLLNHLPGVVRHLAVRSAEHAAASLPPLPAGRPVTIPHGQRAEVLDFVSDLNRKGCKLAVAKQRASAHYGVSRTSIDRLWSRRGRYFSGEAPVQVTMAEALQYLATGQ